MLKTKIKHIKNYNYKPKFYINLVYKYNFI